MTRSAASLTAQIRERLPKTLPRRIGVAVSGGGDSVALMHLLHGIAQAEGVTVLAATVNHGLRPEAAAEAETVAAQAGSLGLSHDTLLWQGWDGSGNLQDQARQARYALLTEWAGRNGVEAIALGHTADDQAETVLMRLARAAGVTGLSSMPSVRARDGVLLLRPMLDISRQELRTYLREIGADWIEDPSNHDTRFDRIKVRQALASLEPIGITAQSLARVAENLAQARDALARYTQESARKITEVKDGAVCIDPAGFAALPREIQRRLLVATINWIAGEGYPPRQSNVDQALEALLNRRTSTIGGCLVFTERDNAWICRELKALQGVTAACNQPWDRRWVVSGPTIPDAEIRALGEDGLKQLLDWREARLPRRALMSTPAVWTGDTVVSAPLSGSANGWHAEMMPNWPEFYAMILSH